MNEDSATAKPVRLRDRFRDEANRAILDAAEQVFSEEGPGARMERIAARAGVAVGTLYNHFRDREALASALACSRREALLGRLDAAVAASAGRSARDQLRAFVSAVAEHARAHGRYLAMLVQSGAGPASASPGKGLLDELIARADLIVSRAIEAGELRPETRPVLPLALVGVIRTASVRVLEGGSTWDALTDPIIDLLLRGAQP
jgi:AcrR family transcriptional regulator